MYPTCGNAERANPKHMLSILSLLLGLGMQGWIKLGAHLVIVGSPAFHLPAKLSQHKGLFEQLSAHIYMTVDPAASKLDSPLIINICQPAIWPQMNGSKVDAGGLMIPEEIAPLVHGIIWIVW